MSTHSSATHSSATDARMTSIQLHTAGLDTKASMADISTHVAHPPLDANLLAARLRSLRANSTILVEEDDSSDCESDTDSEHSSAFTSYSTESLTSAGSSPPASPATKSAPLTLALSTAPPLLYRAPRRRVITPLPIAIFAGRSLSAALATLPTKPSFPPVSMTTSTMYLYQGGITRVMTGGVMLGSF